MWNKTDLDSEIAMIVLDAPIVAAFAALLTAVSALVWSLRRKP